MQALRSLIVAVVAFVVLAVPAVVLADGRVALVVGNSTYAHIGRLPNPDNDARDAIGGETPADPATPPDPAQGTAASRSHQSRGDERKR